MRINPRIIFFFLFTAIAYDSTYHKGRWIVEIVGINECEDELIYAILKSYKIGICGSPTVISAKIYASKYIEGHGNPDSSFTDKNKDEIRLIIFDSIYTFQKNDYALLEYVYTDGMMPNGKISRNQKWKLVKFLGLEDLNKIKIVPYVSPQRNCCLSNIKK